MKFEKVVDGGVVYVRSNLEGLKLPKMPFNDELLSKYLDFRIGQTYKTLAASRSQEEWSVVYGYPEKFLNCKELTDHDRASIICTMVYMHYLIRSVLNADQINTDLDTEAVRFSNKAKMLDLQTKLSMAMCSLDQSINFLDKLRAFAANVNYVPQPVVNGNPGERSQDTEEKTLYVTDQITLTSLTVLAKLFSPVSGTFINCCKEIKLDNMFHEVHCNVMYRRMLDNKYPALMDKLDGIIRGIVEKKLKELSETDAYNGNTVEVLVAKNIASMITRKLVVVNIDQKGTNLATYIYACVQSTTNSSSGNKHKLTVKSRAEPSDKLSFSNTDGNESILETESVSSVKPADFEDIITFAVDTLVKQQLDEWDKSNRLASDAYREAAAWYSRDSHKTVDPVNSYLIGIMFGEELLGGQSVESLRSIDLSRLIALAQIILINDGYSHELVTLISARNTGSPKMDKDLTGAEVVLTSGGGWRSSTLYSNLNNRFRFSCNGITWDTGLYNIVMAVTHTVYTIDVAPSIWKYMDAENVNDRMFSASEQLAENICILISNYTAEES